MFCGGLDENIAELVDASKAVTRIFNIASVIRMKVE